MKKRILVFFLIFFITLSSIFSSTFDYSLSIGQENYIWYPEGISFSYGMNFGISKRVELDLFGVSNLTPKPFTNNLFGIELDIALLGARSTGGRVAGIGINVLLGIGGFYQMENNGAGLLVSITPLTVGNPITGRRERLLKTSVGWDFVNNKLLVSFSLLNLDFYIVGTYRDYDMITPTVYK